MARERELVPIEKLLDLDELRAAHRTLAPRHIRAALPRGWALADDHRHAYRDLRLLFREGWILIVGLISFGAVGGAFLWGAMPAGWGGVLRALMLVAITLFLGAVVAPIITRALQRR